MWCVCVVWEEGGEGERERAGEGLCGVCIVWEGGRKSTGKGLCGVCV